METLLQFGSGKFLRAFADLFIHQANQEGQNLGQIVVAQSTGDSRANLLNQQGGKYHVLIRGLSGGKMIDQVEECASISRALVAAEQWQEILAFARSADLRYVISNTAEVGYNLDPKDKPDSASPKSFPAKLLLVLKERFEAKKPGVTVIPCELFEHNADVLLKLVLQLARSWQLSESLQDWIKNDCFWLNTLVDRIVVGTPKEHPLLDKDALLILAEPYALFAIEDKPGAAPFIRHPAVIRTPDVQPYFLRKVRILNAAHTAMVGKAQAKGIVTVYEAMHNPEIVDWLNRLLFEEVVPILEGRVDKPAEFARQTLERFRNPYLEHKFADIAAYHDMKVKIRLESTRDEFVKKFGRSPPLLEEAIAAKAMVAPAK